jgi:hypothetical protein
MKQRRKPPLGTGLMEVEMGGLNHPTLLVNQKHHHEKNFGFVGNSLDHGGTSGTPVHTSSAWTRAELGPPVGDGPFDLAEI